MQEHHLQPNLDKTELLVPQPANTSSLHQSRSNPLFLQRAAEDKDVLKDGTDLLRPPLYIPLLSLSTALIWYQVV